MPELPEVEALCRFLDAATAGRQVERAELASLSALKTVDPPLEALVGKTVAGWQRRGKWLCLQLDGVWLVLHLALGGWVRWYERVPDARARLGKGPLALRVGVAPDEELGPSPGFDVTEAGTEKRLALWLVADPLDVTALAQVGPDPLAPGFDADRLGRALVDAGGTLKTALTTQSVVAGIGNAYSDEILHRARLSPFKPASGLTPDEVARLHGAVTGVLGEAAARAADEVAWHGPAVLKAEKQRAMAVHGRAGQPCPVCGDTVRQVSYARRSLEYCPTCQTGGKVLADRRLSRLVT